MEMGTEYFDRQLELAKNLGFKRLLPINTDNYPQWAFEQLWEKIAGADYAFEDTSRGDKGIFIRNMIAPGTYNFEIPGEIFAQLTFAAPGTNAMLHFISLAPANTTTMLTEAAAEIYWFAFEKVGVQRVTGYIPEFNKKVIRLASLMRMKFEGVMRKAFLYNSDYWDIHIYGILATEYRRRK